MIQIQIPLFWSLRLRVGDGDEETDSAFILRLREVIMFLININTFIFPYPRTNPLSHSLSLSLCVSSFISETHRENPLCSPQLLSLSECRNRNQESWRPIQLKNWIWSLFLVSVFCLLFYLCNSQRIDHQNHGDSLFPFWVWVIQWTQKRVHQRWTSGLGLAHS